MEQPLCFRFEGKERTATIHISLEEDGCFLFTILRDVELANRFGSDIDFEIKEDELCRPEAHPLRKLQQAILDAVKLLPEYGIQKSALQAKGAMVKRH